jgi:hypothetical protein
METKSFRSYFDGFGYSYCNYERMKGGYGKRKESDKK